jgi:hypothetical protein
MDAQQEAFKYFQQASRNRDEDPDAYEGARIRYYGIKNGDAWVQQAKQRMADEKLEPIVQSYRSQYEQLETEAKVHKAYTDSIAAIRDKQSSLKDGMSASLRFMQGVLEDKETKMATYNRYFELERPSGDTSIPTPALPIIQYFSQYPASFKILLDVIIGFLIIFVIVLVLRRSNRAFTQSSSAQSYTPTV